MTSELKEIIHQSILNYLHINGFPKTLKRFQSEAQFQRNVVIRCVKLRKCPSTRNELYRINRIQNDTWKDSKVNLEDVYSNYINASRENEDKVVVETETKSKKKKKNKVETEETKPDAPKKVAADDTVSVNGVEVKESKKKTKDKKKKNNQQDQKDECVKVNDDVDPDVVKEEKKSSKKRKRLMSDENGNEADKKETNETVVEEAAKDDEVDGSDEHGNEKPEINGGEKSGSQKSGKKQRIGSAEPKTVNAFQRVKIDQVEFAHEKLQDNSYWAKDGADVGYGAKAQEVLGQVRGRDFRHEKTKKKRGSYRGGQIDLQSHSIKFDYSDEE